jgi:hypothetical protein
MKKEVIEVCGLVVSTDVNIREFLTGVVGDKELPEVIRFKNPRGPGNFTVGIDDNVKEFLDKLYRGKSE